MLGDLLIKPHQRVTKYPLLLQAVLKRSPEAHVQEALSAMVGGLAVPCPRELGTGMWELISRNSQGSLSSYACGRVALTGRPCCH